MPTPNSLENLGLTPDQSAIYLSLIDSGPQTAITLARLTGIKRTYIYHLCKELEKEGLLKLTQKGRTTFFQAQPPDLLLTKAQEKKAQAETALIALESLLPNLQAKYRLTDVKPNVTYYEGIEGIRKLYQDVIKTGEDVILFRSIDDVTDPEAEKILLEHINERTKAGIHTKAITPLVGVAIENYLKNDQARNFERHLTKDNRFLFPSQIMIYGSKIAITSFKNALTTIIDNHEINTTFRQLFALLWEFTAKEHQEIAKDLEQKSSQL